MLTLNIFLAVLLSVALLLSEKKLQVEALDACYSNSDCFGSSYCCDRRSWEDSVCRYGGCVGQPCSSNSDCGGTDECCSGNVCTKSCPCSSDLGCGLNDYCCKQTYSWQSKRCHSGGCVGKYCSSSRDCGGSDECCSNNVCKSGCFDDVAKALASWVIGVIVVSVIIAVAIPIAIVACCCCGVASASRGRPQRGVVMTQPTVGATVVALQNSQTVQSHPAQFQSPAYPPPPAYFNQGQNVPPAGFPQVPPPSYKY